MISENLLTLRKFHKMSQEDVAEKIQVSRQTVAKWESGDSTPDILSCNALAKLYNVTVDDLINYSDKEGQGFMIPPRGKHLFGTVTIGERGQIVIPKRAREIFHLEPGDELAILGDEGQGIALLKVSDLMSLLNSMSVSNPKDKC